MERREGKVKTHGSFIWWLICILSARVHGRPELNFFVPLKVVVDVNVNFQEIKLNIFLQSRAHGILNNHLMQEPQVDPNRLRTGCKGILAERRGRSTGAGRWVQTTDQRTLVYRCTTLSLFKYCVYLLYLFCYS